MTTILFDGKNLHVDSQINNDSYTDPIQYPKLWNLEFRHTEDVWLAGAGDYCEIFSFVHGTLDELSPESEVIVVSKNSAMYFNSSGSVPVLGPAGFGTGGGFALAAFLACNDPVKSVEIACKLDSSSGGEIKSSNFS